MNNLKNFAIISLGGLGDTLLNSALCQDIKKNYPNSKIIFIASKVFFDIAQGLEGVDEAFYFDKKSEHKGLLGGFKFAKKFPYKGKIDCAIITHAQERSILLAKAIGAKIRIAIPKKGLNPVNLIITHKVNYIEEQIRTTYKADYNSDYLKLIGAKSRLSEVKFNVPNKYDEIIKTKLVQNGWDGITPYTVISPTSKDEYRDWDVENIAKFIELLNGQNIPVVFVGTEKSAKMALEIKGNYPNLNFIDLINKTTIFELAALLKMAKTTVSVDTGTMHLSYAVNTHTICLFFKESMIAEWGPMNKANCKILLGNKYLNTNEIVIEKNIEAEEVFYLIESENKSIQ